MYNVYLLIPQVLHKSYTLNFVDTHITSRHGFIMIVVLFLRGKVLYNKLQYYIIL